MNTANLFNYGELLEKESPYPTSNYHLPQARLHKWYTTRILKGINPEESDHDLFSEDEELANKDDKSNKLPHMRTMQEFHTNYQDLKKGNSLFRAKKPTAIQKYLTKIEDLKQIPHAMGVIKHEGSPKELNLEYELVLYVGLTKWATNMRLR